MSVNRHGGYSIRFAANINASEKAAITRALITWRCKTGINFVINPDNAYNNQIPLWTLIEFKKGDLSAASSLAICNYEYTYPCTPIEQEYVAGFHIIFREYKNNIRTPANLISWNAGSPITTTDYNMTI